MKYKGAPGRKRIKGQTIRLEIRLSPESATILKNASKRNHCTPSRIVDNLVMQKLGDPIKVLLSEKRDLALRINEITNKINEFEGAQAYTDKWVSVETSIIDD